MVTKYKPQYLSASVFQMEQLVNDCDKKLDLGFLKLLWVGGEAMNQGFEEKLTTFLLRNGCSAIPLNGYGLTETTAGVMAETMSVHKDGSVGNSEKTVKEIKQILKASLYDYEIPDNIYVIDQLPLTGMNKIDYRTLEKMAENSK